MTDQLSDSDDMQTDVFREPVEPRKCRRHLWIWNFAHTEQRCFRCDKPKDEALSRRGKQSRNYGNRAELSAARKYGGVKIGHAGGPVDVRGKDFNTQVKTHRRLPPAQWRAVFAKLDAKGERCPRLLERFVQGPGLPPVDYFVFQADDFLSWFGKDE